MLRYITLGVALSATFKNTDVAMSATRPQRNKTQHRHHKAQFAASASAAFNIFSAAKNAA